MHQHIRHSLEDYLRGSSDPQDSGLPADFRAHLGECAECARELQSVAEQAHLLRALRNEQEVEPRVGFYGRVIEKIEQRLEAQRSSFWAPLLDRKFGFRLAVASAALVALLGTYLITSEPAGPEFASAPAVVYTGDSGAESASGLSQSARSEAQAKSQAVRQEEQRDAVLVDLASYHQ